MHAILRARLLNIKKSRTNLQCFHDPSVNGDWLDSKQVLIVSYCRQPCYYLNNKIQAQIHLNKEEPRGSSSVSCILLYYAVSNDWRCPARRLAPEGSTRSVCGRSTKLSCKNDVHSPPWSSAALAALLPVAQRSEELLRVRAAFLFQFLAQRILGYRINFQISFSWQELKFKICVDNIRSRKWMSWISDRYLVAALDNRRLMRHVPFLLRMLVTANKLKNNNLNFF